ncbi:aspartyl-tRNA synthetase [Thermovibrio ammonificans HB-1]|uniref:Aspartate--tRNA(Asp/Asn) ligase n=1 Tax=Thermovibrio ammonificans (strain DSM 15698 / JCM 12110 / HB-1) TaxID=648996 RepID=E8T646_THEA1|nr:aspartate--tRNA ligase [Thermovibrio ammonificans]ADU96630.1 aspartyl-tRNA synthetase [Thermovibrio ammonificans HB-1]
MLEHLGSFKRTHYCGEISEKDLGKDVKVAGWVDTTRDHGGVVFIDLRDRTGKVQVVFSPEISKELVEKAKKLRHEYVVAVEGEVRRRPEGTENPKLKTGNYEIYAKKLQILNRSLPLPFPIEDNVKVSEEVRLKYRFLDLRRPKMAENLLFRHRLYRVVREVFNEEGFVEVETPYLTKSTPEGARDFLVPSRIYPGKFYALPQSPQLFKQILMVAGIDRYYQIARCFRDEDLRADRQPEFTQIDFEMSFVAERDVMAVAEKFIRRAYKELLGIEIGEIPVMTYDEAMSRFGTDRPDTRFGLELKEITDIAKQCNFKVFRSVAEKGGIVKALNFKGGAKLSRKEIDELTKFVGVYGAKGLAWIKVLPDGLQSPIVKFFTEGEMNEILKRLEAEVGDILFFVADKPEVVNAALANLRLKLGKMANLIDESKVNILWVVDFPMFEWNEEEERWEALHHPFTSPKEEDIEKLLENPGAVRARAYDMVLNGVEIGGGSIRIHREDVQEKVFKVIGLSEEEAKERFGFLLEALKYGAPPHGGMAFGLDRLCAIMRGEESIRDVIAFPKTQRGQCLLTGAPDTVREEQLDELHIEVKTKEEGD